MNLDIKIKERKAIYLDITIQCTDESISEVHSYLQNRFIDYSILSSGPKSTKDEYDMNVRVYKVIGFIDEIGD